MVLAGGIARLRIIEEASFAIRTGVGSKTTYKNVVLHLCLNISHLIVENDSKILIGMVAINCSLSSIVSILVRNVCNLLTLDWQFKFHNTWREEIEVLKV